MSGEGSIHSIARAHEHADFCEWHHDQYAWECTCSALAPEQKKRPEWLGPGPGVRGKHELHADFCGWHEDQDNAACGCGARGGAASIDTGDGHIYDNGDGARKGNWMQTFSGRQFWPIDPRSSEVFIEDIAHALANSCRYAGHCDKFYSVAEHSVLVSYCVPPELALLALLHDASEAYVVDIPRPLKPFLAGYKEIEHRVWLAVADRFGLPHEMPDAIKEADNAVLLAEGEQIMKPHPAPWCVPGEAADVEILCLKPEHVEARFLSRYHQLMAARSA